MPGDCVCMCVCVFVCAGMLMFTYVCFTKGSPTPEGNNPNLQYREMPN